MVTNAAFFEEEQLDRSYDLRLLKWLYPLTKPYRLLLSCSIVLVILITILDLALPYITKIAIDRYIVPKMETTILTTDTAGDSKARYLRVDMMESQTAAIVQRYASLFTHEGSYAMIRFDDLSHLDKKDILVLRKGDIAGISIITLLFLALIGMNFIFNFGQVMVMEYTGQMIMHDLRIRLFNHIQGLTVAFFTRHPVGRLVTRVTNDTQNMHELVTSVIAFIFKDIFLLAGITIVLLTINWKLTATTFTILPFVIYAAIHFAVKARDIYRILRVKIADINTSFSETIGGIKVIQLFRQERENYRRFEHLNHEYYEAGMRQIHVYAVFMPIIELLGATATALIIFYGGCRVLAESISLGALVAFIAYMRMFFRPLRDIAEKYNIMQNALSSAERIHQIINNRECELRTGEVADETPDLQEKIENIVMDNVSFSYVAGETVLSNVSLHIRPGETVAFVGPTGSGKTTLINLLTRFYEPQAGRILINGQEIGTIDINRLRSKIALVTQDPFLFSGTIRDNILNGSNHMSDAELDRIITASNCRSLIDKLPKGVDTELTEGGASVSSGERQLISIARAFARDPDLILLDEATSYIDSETEQKIQAALANLMNDRTSIIVAHRLSTARTADRIFVLNKHRIIESGTHQELMAQKGFYFRLHQLQQ
ncbi:MAG TPA: ABC transporter ATP-binding protein [Deltaproteobacteria bacterium]|nr:ABC transporter ATP-binding protein [Deltaproteobacteria bacterium]